MSVALAGLAHDPMHATIRVQRIVGPHLDTRGSAPWTRAEESTRDDTIPLARYTWAVTWIVSGRGSIPRADEGPDKRRASETKRAPKKTFEYPLTT